MFDWSDSRKLDAICYDLVLSDFPRGQNRARIQNLANGAPPYSHSECEENQIEVNVSDLAHTRLMHDGRCQFANAFLKAGNFAKASTDMGPIHKRGQRSAFVTRAWNRRMKRSIQFFERLRAEFGLLVLQGISPGVWENEDKWCTKPLGVEDVLLPSETLLGFDNLPVIILRRAFTAPELHRLTSPAEKRDPGWNEGLVKKSLEWLDSEMTMLRSTNWPEVWSPEKVEERTKQDAGFFLGDQAPKIDCFDIYGYVDGPEGSGWVRRIIFDSWGEPNIKAGKTGMNRTDKNPMGNGRWKGDDFLYSSGSRLVANNWQQILSFQFADLSAVFPARYYSVRSLGWITYAACHLGNRMRCKFYEAVMEALMPYFEVDSQADVQNALKLNLVNRGFIDKTIRPVKAQDRWQVNANLVELGLSDNARIISDNASAFAPTQKLSNDSTEKTRFQVMAELQQMTSLVSAALQQAGMYQVFEFREIFRRFLKPNSSDPDVRSFRNECLSNDVPEEMLCDPDAWDIDIERVMGAGNKTLEMTISEQLMAWQQKFEPESQRVILHDAVLALTDNPGKAKELVPEMPQKVTPSTREAELIAGTLMQGIPVEPMAGENNIEIIETLLKILAEKIAPALQQGEKGMVPPQELSGLDLIAQQIEARIQVLSQDKDEGQRVKAYQDMLTKLQNQLKAFAQRFQQAMKAQQQAVAKQNGDGGAQAKNQALIIGAQTKAELSKQSHAQKTAQRQISFEQKIAQDKQAHEAELAALDLKTAGEIRRDRFDSLSE